MADSHDPRLLYEASLERMEETRRAFNAGEYVLTMYLSGLAVECILQAIAFLDKPVHDARHDLHQWLRRCRRSLQDEVKNHETCPSWSRLIAVWRNDLRYLSESGLLGYLRKLDLHYGIAGGRDAIIQENARRLRAAAATIHAKGVYAWNAYTRR